MRPDRGAPQPDLADPHRPEHRAAAAAVGGLATRRVSLTVLEQQAARTAGLLTERRTKAAAVGGALWPHAPL